MTELKKTITDHFRSSLIKSHYQKAKNQAIAFLFTIGAKALVLAKQNEIDSDTNDINFLVTQLKQQQQGLKEEAELKREMIHGETIRILKRKFFEKIGVEVYKYSRNGKLSLVCLRLKNFTEGSFFTWKSKFRTHKKFKLDDALIVIPLLNRPMMEYNAAVTGDSAIMEYFEYNRIFIDEFTVPFLRFRNGSRCLDLRFKNIHELEACLQIIQHYQPMLQLCV